MATVAFCVLANTLTLGVYRCVVVAACCVSSMAPSM